jgi:hypothetical protein
MISANVDVTYAGWPIAAAQASSSIFAATGGRDGGYFLSPKKTKI